MSDAPTSSAAPTIMNKLNKIAVPIVLPLAVILTGCAAHTDSPDPHAVVAEPPASHQQENGVKPFGSVFTYEDGLSISVSVPTPYTPTDDALAIAKASGLSDDLTIRQFAIAITNGTKDPMSPATLPKVSSGGTEAFWISDVANHVGFGPSDEILPGQSVQWIEAFGVADVNDITMTISPDFDYNDTTFTTKK
jgi:hypothetical protein